MAQTGAKDEIDFQQYTHEMNNSLAYVVTNLHLLQEELESASDPVLSNKLIRLVLDAQEGSDRLANLIREMRRQSWSGDEQAPRRPQQSPLPTSDGKTGKILVIDDEVAILTAVKRALRSHDVDTAQDADCALQMVESNTYDLLLCDLIMGSKTGIDLYIELKKTHPEVASRVVFMTAGGFSSAARDFLGTVNNGVLHKPFDVKTLRWMVSQKLGEFRRK